MAKEYQNIKLEKSVKSRLDASCKGISYSDYVDSMLRYFEITNIEPRSWKVYHGLQTENNIERTIKIIKAIEKEYIKPMYEILKAGRIQGSFQPEPSQENVPVAPGEIDMEKFMPIAEVQELIDKYATLTEATENRTKEISELKRERENLSRQLEDEKHNISGERINKEAIKQAFDSMEVHFEKLVHSKDIRIRQETYEIYKERIMKELNVC
ncbi:MAG: hypothetical protein LBV47_01200 [Bacteroidales bacterium]|jgi:hypothetical protein|nr:hypothetical protein [Bacteroidales bacterium]